MTFLALNLDKSYLTQEKSELEYQEMTITNQYNYVTESMADYSSEKNADMNSAYAKKLESYQQLYDSQKAAVESKLEVINAEIESFDKAVQTNVKSECKLSISV